MGSSEARRGTKTFIRKTEAMFNFSRINWPEGELLNNSLYGLYECSHRTKKKGDICELFFCHQRLSIVKRKIFTQVCHIFVICFEMNIVCVFRAELTMKPPFLTKNVVFHPRKRIPSVLARNARSSPQWRKVDKTDLTYLSDLVIAFRFVIRGRLTRIYSGLLKESNQSFVGSVCLYCCLCL